MSPNLEKLETLTKNLPDLAALSDKHPSCVVKFKTECGQCLGLGLLNQRDVAVSDTLLSQGARLAPHAQRETEWLIIYNGRLRVFVGDEEPREIAAGESVQFPPDTPHCVEALETTWLIAVSVPASPGYPADARH